MQVQPATDWTDDPEQQGDFIIKVVLPFSLHACLVCMIALIEHKWPDGSSPLRQCDYLRNLSPFQTI